MHRAMPLKNPPCVASTCINFVTKRQVCSSSVTLRRAFIQFIQRPFGDGHRIEYRLAKVRTTQRIQPGIGSRPNYVAVPFNEHIVDSAIVAPELFQIAALWRNEIGHFFGAIKVADVVAPQPSDEIGVRNKILTWFTGRLQMWRIVRAESPTLETKIAVRRIRRRDRPRKLRNRDGMLFVANIDNPVGKKNLVAIRVSGFSVGQHESAVENSAINRMKRDAHPGILRGRFEAAHFPLFYGIAQIKNDETVDRK